MKFVETEQLRMDTDSQSSLPKYTDVAIIGNGPAGISLSFLLSGNWPYYNGTPHHNEILNCKLEDSDTELSLLEQDLDFLSEGLEGRSSNPVALLFDTLAHPQADLGRDEETHLTWRRDQKKSIPHVVLGRGPPGGAWQMIEGEMLTLSLGKWMELPDSNFKEFLRKRHRCSCCCGLRKTKCELPITKHCWVRGFRSNCVKSTPSPSSLNDRASVQDVADFYTNYVKTKKLEKYFRNYSTVTSVRRLPPSRNFVHDQESGEIEEARRTADEEQLWEVRGYTESCTASDNGTNIQPFCYHARNVVLATGTFDKPNRLHVSGESYKFVHHSVADFEQLIKQGVVSSNSDPVLIVGAGLSAADAILHAQNNNIPVVHAFRRRCEDSELIYNKLPKAMYPEYHKILRMMKGNEDSIMGYQPYPRHVVHRIKNDGRVVLCSVEGDACTTVRISHVIVLVGSLPNMEFMHNDCHSLGIEPGKPIDSKHNPIDIDLLSYESIQERSLYAMGALVGDTFVRFIVGGSLGITADLVRKKKKALGLI